MKKRTHLYHELLTYGESDFYPYHMPGHKRHKLGKIPGEILKTDITEIDGFDNLHQAEGILAQIQEQAGRLYHADETFYMVNGSTGGILSAISTALPEGGHLLICRGCHKSVYHAIYLRHLKVSYLYPKLVEDFGFSEAISAKQVEEALRRSPDIGAVLIVSPTYEGRIADVAAIAAVVHERGIPLIVDEAHGAHLGMAEHFAPGSCTADADLVIHSVHKTLPAMTQTALLHVNGNLIDRDRLRRFLRIYQTSSPSYVLMSSICDAMDIVEQKGEKLFAEFYQNYHNLIQHLDSCRNLKFMPWNDVEAGKQDIGKLVISAKNNRFLGQWIYNQLRDKFHLQCEMAQGTYCLAMFTLADSKEAYDRMEQALFAIDKMLENAEAHCNLADDSLLHDGKKEVIFCPEQRYSLSEAWEMPGEWVDLRDSVNQVVLEFVNLYPPGIPLLVPGEVMTKELLEKIVLYQRLALNVQGIIHSEDGDYIKILK